MTPEERQKQFIDAYNKLVEQYGIQFSVTVKARQLGPVVQAEPQLVLQLVEGWKEPERIPTWQENAVSGNIPVAELGEHSNGKPILTDEEINKALHGS